VESTSCIKPAFRSTSNTRGIERIDLAYVELGSSESARDISRDIVRELVRSHQPVERADIAKASDLKPVTISAIVKQVDH